MVHVNMTTPKGNWCNFCFYFDNGRTKHTCANIIVLKTKENRKVETFDDLEKP